MGGVETSRIYSELPLPVQRGLERVVARLQTLDLHPLEETPLHKPTIHFLVNRGKLARPILVLMGAYISGGDPLDVVDVAVAVELVHTASLIHDDIIDRDVERRGVPTVHVMYGDEYAILAGDALLAKAIELISPYGRDVVKCIARAAIKMGAGEALDYMYQARKSVPPIEDYLRIIEYKTVSLIRAAAVSGAMAAGGGDHLVDLLSSYGENVGFGFQIRDDVLNCLGIVDFKPKGGGKRDVDNYRPNIVSVLRKSQDLTWEEALVKAIHLNNKYTQRAMEVADSLGERGRALASYAEWFFLRLDDLRPLIEGAKKPLGGSGIA